jgi:hypothetical protein
MQPGLAKNALKLKELIKKSICVQRFTSGRGVSMAELAGSYSRNALESAVRKRQSEIQDLILLIDSVAIPTLLDFLRDEDLTSKPIYAAERTGFPNRCAGARMQQGLAAYALR